MYAFTLVYYNITSRLTDYCNVQGLKEAKTKQIDIKLLFQKVRKWSIKVFILL